MSSTETEQKPLTSRLTDTLKSTVPSQESEITRWRRTFDRHAKESDGSKYLDPSSFIDAVAPTEEGFNRISRQQYSILFRVADSSNSGRITFDEFVVFETLLKRPDADYQLAFRVFDLDGSGNIDYDQFKAVLSANLAASEIPFDFDCDWIKLYLGQRGGNHIVGFQEFAQLLKGFRGERVRQAFRYFDTDNDGFIAPTEFQKIMIEVAGHKLSDSIIERLPTLSLMTPGQRISYSEVFAFHNIIRELDAVEKTIQRATRKAKDGKIDVTDFLDEAATARNSVFTPLEAAIIFHLASRGAVGTSQRLSMADFDSLLDAKWAPPAPQTAAPSAIPTTTTALNDVAEAAYSFTMGGIAGAVGAFVVFPIDLVKTRIQNQRSNVVGEVLYRNPWDCAKKIYKYEGGIRGFYRGTVPQMIGVAPEKSIKLVVNGYIRDKFTNPDTGRISFGAEVLAGGSAGFCQVSVTCPLEIVKIRLQMAGEVARAAGGGSGQGVIQIIRGLGLVGLYKGAIATMARDVPFSMIYFPVYAHMKKDVFHEGRQGKVLSLTELLIAAGIGGIPAAALTTPPDVIKTRLQSQARAGETVYRGLGHAFKTILVEEGPKALFKGAMFRVVRSSPQFAVTLTVYEVLARNFPNPFASAAPGAAAARPIRATTDISRVRARNALRILLDCSSSFGMVNDKMVAKGIQNLPKGLRSYPTVGKELA